MNDDAIKELKGVATLSAILQREEAQHCAWRGNPAGEMRALAQAKRFEEAVAGVSDEVQTPQVPPIDQV